MNKVSLDLFKNFIFGSNPITQFWKLGKSFWEIQKVICEISLLGTFLSHLYTFSNDYFMVSSLNIFFSLKICGFSDN